MHSGLRAQLHAQVQKALFRQSNVPFVSSSGERPNWIFDFRMLLLDGESLDTITSLVWDELEEFMPCQIGGLETASIALIGGLLLKGKNRGHDATGFYIRKSRRKDGFQKHVEGMLNNRDIVLVDDILNSGKSIMRQISVLEEAGRQVRAIIALVRFREIPYYEAFTKRGIEIRSIFTLEDFPETGGMLRNTMPTSAKQQYSIAWKFQSANPSYRIVVPKSAPVLDTERVYFGADNGTMWALNQKDGGEAWHFRTLFGAGEKRIFSSPALMGGKLYFGAYDGNVYCLDAQTGKKRWVYRSADWVGSSPCTDGNGCIFIGLEFGLWKKQGGLVCLDAETGREIWMQSIPTLVHSSPFFIAKHRLVVVGSSEGIATAFTAKSGTPRWSVKTNGAVRAGFTYDAKTNTVAFGSEDGTLYMVDAKSGAIRHAFKTMEPVYTTPLANDGVLYAGCLDKRVLAIDISTGTLRWEFWTSGRVFASPLIIGDSLYIGSNDGRLYELDAATGRERSYLQLDERIVNRIAYNESTQRIFLPTHANEMYCLERL